MKLKLFIIFHRYLSKDLINHYCKTYDTTFFGVNEDIEKRIDPIFDKYTLYEYNLSKYEKLFQKFGFGESSCIVHVGHNDLHTNYEYIGFTQYDMLLRLNKLDRQLKPNACIYTRLQGDKKNVFKQSQLDRIPIDFFFRCYNEYFDTNYSENDFKTISKHIFGEIRNIYRCSFIIHKDVYNKLYPFWSQYMYKLFTYLYVDDGFKDIKTKTNIHDNYRFCSWVMEITLGITLILEKDLSEYICIKADDNGQQLSNYDYNSKRNQRDYEQKYSKELILDFQSQSVLKNIK